MNTISFGCQFLARLRQLVVVRFVETVYTQLEERLICSVFKFNVSGKGSNLVMHSDCFMV